jgi:hypothetical protein
MKQLKLSRTLIVILFLFVIGTLSLLFKIQPAKAEGPYNVTFAQSGIGSEYYSHVDYSIDNGSEHNGTVPFDVPVDIGSNISYSFQNTVDGDTGVRYVLIGVSPESPQTITAPLTITGSYKTQYDVTFAQSGVGSDFSGNVMSVESVDYTRTGHSDWYDTGADVTLSFYSPLVVTLDVKQYLLTGVSGNTTSLSLTVSGATTVIGSYTTQYYVTFAQSGVGGDFSGDLVKVNGANYTSIGHSSWFDSGASVAFSFYSPLVAIPNSKQYVLTGAIGNSTASPLTISAATTVIGTYKTQWYVSIDSAHGSPTQSSQWIDDGGGFNVSVTNPDLVVVGHEWNLTGLIVDGSSHTLANSMSFDDVTANHTIEFDWTEQWLIIVVSAHGTPTEVSQWVNAGHDFSVSVTNPDVVVPGGHQWNLTGLSLDYIPQALSNAESLIDVQANHTIEFNWTEQWYISIASGHGSPSESSQWVNDGVVFSVSVTNPDVVSALVHRWNLTGLTVDSVPQTLSNTVNYASVHASHAIVFAWTEQWYVSVTSPHDSPTGPGWVDAGGSFLASVTSPADIVSGDHQWICTGYKLDGGSLTAGTSYTFTEVGGNHTIEFDWKEQYYLDVNSAYDTPGGAGWYDSGTTAHATLSDGTVSGGAGTRHVFTNWSSDASGTNYAESDAITMDGPKTATADWKTRYLVTYSATGNVLPVTLPSDEWVDSGGSAVGVFPPQVTVAGTRCNFVSDNRTAIIEPSLIVGTYQTQYYVTFTQSGIGSDFIGDVMSVDSVNYSRTGHSGWYDDGSSVGFSFYSPLNVDSGKRYMFISADASWPLPVAASAIVVGNYTTQYYLTVQTSPSGISSPIGGGWYDSGTTAHVSTAQYVDIVSGSSRYRFDSWTGASGTYSDATVLMDSAKTATANYLEQHNLTFASFGVGSDFSGTVMTVNGTVHDRLGVSFWADSGDVYSFTYWSLLSVNAGEQYVRTGINGSSPLHVSAATTVTGRYVAQYLVTFDQDGLDGTATGTVVTVNSTAITSAGLPFKVWVNSSNSLAFSYANVSSTASDMRFVVYDVNANSPLTVTGSVTIIGSYETQLLTMRLKRTKGWYWTQDTTITCTAQGDLYGNGVIEIVTGGYYFDGVRDVAQLVIWNGSNRAVIGVSTWYWFGDTTINSIAISDVDEDGHMEIVTGGYYFDGTRDVAQLIVWDGSTLAAKHIEIWYWFGNTNIRSLAVGDVDGDGHVEIVTGGYYFDGTRDVAQLIVWNGSNLALKSAAGWYWSSDTLINSVAIGNVYGNSSVEIVTGGYYFDGTRDVAQLIVWDGSTLAAKHIEIWYWFGNTSINSVAIGDVDGDGHVEIVTGGSHNDGTRDVAQLIVWDGSNLALKRVTGWYWFGNTAVNSVCIGDVDGDGHVEIVTGGYYFDGIRDVSQLVTWEGSTLTVKQVAVWFGGGNTAINCVVIGDVNDDGAVEIVTGGNYYDGSRTIAQLTVWVSAYS